MPKIGDIVEVEIEGLASTGKGVTHFEEASIFVPMAVPGDILKVRIVTGRKSFFEAEIKEIVKESESRVKPVCKYFGDCGACDWLHIDYDRQVLEKEKMLKFYFSRNRQELPPVNVFPAVNPLYYREKIRLQNGFYARKSNRIVEVDECHIIKKDFWPLLKIKRDSEECFGYDYVSKKISSDQSYYFHGDLKIAYHPKGFVQSNLSMNQVLTREVLAEVAEDSTKVLELYSGNGNFSLPLSRKVKKVVSVEGSSYGFSLLMENIKENSISNIDPYHEDTRDFAKKRSKYDCVILDPPRTGSEEVLKDISKLTDKIVYVSCDAAILVKEVKELVGFEVTKIKLIDMFPQTRHFETVLVLERKK